MLGSVREPEQGSVVANIPCKCRDMHWVDWSTSFRDGSQHDSQRGKERKGGGREEGRREEQEWVESQKLN